jgi:hypothetical protein
VLEARKAALGEAHSETLRAARELGSLLEAAGRAEEAAALSRHSAAVRAAAAAAADCAVAVAIPSEMSCASMMAVAFWAFVGPTTQTVVVVTFGPTVGLVGVTITKLPLASTKLPSAS